MPDVPIVDAHVHLWDPALLRMPWLDGNQALARPYGLAQYAEHTAGIAIDAFVYLEVDVAPSYRLTETRLVAALAAEDPRLQAIVACAPLEDGDCVRSFLADLVAISPLVRGVRRITQGEADPAFCLRPGFVAGVKLLPTFGLSCDLCIAPHQLNAIVELVRQCPEVNFILDHIGKPAIQASEQEPWRAQLDALAALPNVMCKVSGVITEADRQAWTLEQIAPYITHALAVFGEDRVVFGSDWPVVLLAGSYRRWVEALDALTADRSPAARRKLWAENARRFYRLEG